MLCKSGFLDLNIIAFWADHSLLLEGLSCVGCLAGSLVSTVRCQSDPPRKPWQPHTPPGIATCSLGQRSLLGSTAVSTNQPVLSLHAGPGSVQLICGDVLLSLPQPPPLYPQDQFHLPSCLHLERFAGFRTDNGSAP